MSGVTPSQDGASRPAPPPPPRPPMSDRTPAPIPRAAPVPGVMRAARAVWTASLVAGALVLIVAVLRRTDQFDRLTAYLGDLQPDTDTSTLQTTATIAFWGGLAVLALLTVVELLLRPRAERRAAARWVLALVLVLHAAAAVAVDPLVALGPLATASRALLAVQLGLAVLALVLTAIAARVVRRIVAEREAEVRVRR